jgi:hypothetical protein
MLEFLEVIFGFVGERRRERKEREMREKRER